MIATALSFPQEKRRAGWVTSLYHFLSLSFLGGTPMRAGFAIAATITIVTVTTLTMPSALSLPGSDMDSTVSELHDMLLYDTIDAAI